MANGHGGYRRPTNPAPVSGPGKLSRRTDGGPGQKLMATSGGAYGDRQATLDQERGAAMSQENSITPTPVPGMGGAGNSTVIPFDAPSQRPDEPITQGVDIGPGAGPEVLGTQTAAPTGSMTALLMRLAPTSVTGSLGKLLQAAQSRNA